MSLVQVIIGLLLVTAAILLLGKVTNSFKTQEKVQKLRMSSNEMLSFVAAQVQAQPIDKGLCLCCLALKDTIPAGRTLTRETVTTCPELCTNTLPIHGYRRANGGFRQSLAKTEAIERDDVFVTIESCTSEANGLGTVFQLYADWQAVGSGDARASARLKFFKAR